MKVVEDVEDVVKDAEKEEAAAAEEEEDMEEETEKAKADPKALTPDTGRPLKQEDSVEVELVEVAVEASNNVMLARRTPY